MRRATGRGCAPACVADGRAEHACAPIARRTGAAGAGAAGRRKIQRAGRGLAVSSDNADARRACQLGPGHETSRRPLYLLRYTSTDLNKLPDAMEQALRSGRYHAVEVGACPSAQAGDFAVYQVAVLLYE
jgi:hypothetical protein